MKSITELHTEITKNFTVLAGVGLIVSLTEQDPVICVNGVLNTSDFIQWRQVVTYTNKFITINYISLCPLSYGIS